MRTTLALLCVLGTSLAGFSQDKNFDLSKYKSPDYKRHELEFNFNSSGRSYQQTKLVPLESGSASPSEEEYSYSFFNSSSSLDYQYDNLTRKQIHHLHSRLDGRYNFSNSNSYGNKTKEYNPNIQWNIDGFRRYYLKENKFFLEGMTGLSYYYDSSKRTYTNMNDNKSRYNSLTLSLGIGVGTGRIEKVNDFWQAYYILEKLNGQNSLDRELQEKDIFEFAVLASKLKNKRFFDARLRRISELQALDSLMHSQGLVTNRDISYFTILNDYWSYGNFQDRESGRELKTWAMPEYSRQYSKSNGDSSLISTKTSVISNISFKCTKPLNLYWDRYFNARISNETMIENSGYYFENYPANAFFSNASFGYGYFPDSRTSVKGLLGYSGQKIIVLHSSSGIPNEPNQWMNKVYLQLEGNYYISPRLQITGNFNVSYSDKSYGAIDDIQTNYNLGLRYAIL